MKLLILLLLITTASIGNAKKYYIFRQNLHNWHAAYADCLSRGLQLATITSPEEQSQIEALIRKENLPHFWFWLGAVDLGDEGTFVWVPTGKPITYTKWSASQPDNGGEGGNEHCLTLWPHPTVDNIAWNDLNCGDPLAYICEDVPPCTNDAKK